MIGMTRTTAELLLLAALIAAAWMASGYGLRAPASAGGAPRASIVLERDPVGEGLSERATRLRAFLASPPPASPGRRNLFSFASARRTASAVTVENHAAVPERAAPASRPELVLSGIAEDAGIEGPVRTAVIAAAGQLVFAKEGDRILSRFVVVRIAADAVQVRDTERGDVFTLAFK